MRTIAAVQLGELVAAIMQGAGCAPQEASTVAHRLVDSNLVGHDSHGVIRVGKYLEWMGDGWAKANQTPSVVFETDTIAIVDGNRGFGQVVGEFAGRLGTAKAAKSGIALVGLRNCGHLGRVGDWADLAAAAGQVSLHFLNTSGAQRVAPFGGSDRRLSTNPITVGVPIAGGDPVILDITTSMVAEGKLFVASNKGEDVPPGMLSIYIAPDVYDADGAVTREAARFVEWVKASPPATPGQPVLLPGEIERMTRARRMAEGIIIDDQTYADLLTAASSVGVTASQVKTMIGA